MFSSTPLQVLEGMSLRALKAAYEAGTLTPTQTIDWIINKLKAESSDANWTCILPAEQLYTRAKALETSGDSTSLPLLGVPFSVKDNIHIAGLPTTAGNSAYSFMPKETAEVVQAMLDAGAMLIGKNTMDEFATGVVGIRSTPHPVNPFNEKYIPGGSSSGSAVVVSKRQVCFSLGSDTGGSGRVPAALCNIVGFKPSPDLFGNHGMVYANRSIDCIPLFTKTVEESQYIFNILMDRFVPRRLEQILTDEASFFVDRKTPTLGIPDDSSIRFFGDDESKRCFNKVIDEIGSLGAKILEVDISPFVQAGKRLFDGPMLSERFLSVNDAVNGDWSFINPTVRDVVQTGGKYGVSDLWDELDLLKRLNSQVRDIFNEIDILLVPTAGTIYTIDEVNQDPVNRNSDMAYYTNFGNLLNLSVISVPGAFRNDHLPFGLSLIGDTYSDAKILDFAKRWEEISGVIPGTH